MTGSGLFVVNPPWTLAAELEAVLPVLTAILANADETPHASVRSG